MVISISTPGSMEMDAISFTIIMRSDSELLIFIFRSEKRMGSPISQNPTGKNLICESDGPSRQILDQDPKIDDSTHRIIKSKNGIGL